MKLDLNEMRRIAGLPLTESRLQKLINYYTDGFGGFDDTDPFEARIKKYIVGINSGDIKPGSPEYKKAASAILSYGTEVSDEELK